MKGDFSMPQTETKENSRLLMTALAFFFSATVCQMPSMLKSGFLGNFGAEVITSFIVLAAFIFIVFKIFKTESSVYAAVFTSVLLFANWSQLMLYYTCNCETDNVLKKVISFMIYVIAVIIATWAAFLVLNRIKHYRNICLVLFSVIAVGISLFVILFSGTNNNTSTTTSGFQPAILLMFLMLYAFAGAVAGNNEFFTRIIYIGLFWFIMASLTVKHEMGIPVMTYSACAMMYIFFNKSKKELWFIIVNTIIPAAGFSAIMIISPSIRKDTLRKLIERTGDNEHWLMAKANLQASSLFGSESYDVFLAEASTDYSLNTDIHYWGFIFGILVLVLFFIMSLSIYKNILNISNDNILSNVRKLAYCAVCVITVYNILDNICGFPIIGVQLICSGVSRNMAILSGLLMGSIIADPQKMKSSVFSFLEKTGIITETA